MPLCLVQIYLPREKRPFSEQDIELIQKHFDEETQEKIFYKNALKFYKFQNENRICSSGKRIYKLSIIFIMRFDISLNKNIIKLYLMFIHIDAWYIKSIQK